MLFARYSIDLPADYDMTRIHDRVTAKADHWNARDGLLFKAFCVTERGTAGAAHNSYAPFYVWRTPEAFGDFLTGAEYGGLASSFGTVPVRTGTVLHVAAGTASNPAAGARAVSCQTVRLDAGGPVTDALAGEERRHRAALALDGVCGQVVALDPNSWTLHRYTLLVDADVRPPAADGAECRLMRVLHVATPGRVDADAMAGAGR